MKMNKRKKKHEKKYLSVHKQKIQHIRIMCKCMKKKQRARQERTILLNFQYRLFSLTKGKEFFLGVFEVLLLQKYFT